MVESLCVSGQQPLQRQTSSDAHAGMSLQCGVGGLRMHKQAVGFLPQGVTMCAGFQARSSSPLVTRLLKGHGVVLGKTRMHELAVGVTTINMHGGPVLNPYNNTMHTGGPSRLMLPYGAPDMALRT